MFVYLVNLQTLHAPKLTAQYPPIYQSIIKGTKSGEKVQKLLHQSINGCLHYPVDNILLSKWKTHQIDKKALNTPKTIQLKCAGLLFLW